MKRVTVVFSFDVDDGEAFVEQADRACRREWGSGVRDVRHGTPLLVQAAVELFIASNGKPWPEGVADDANLRYFGYVADVSI